MTERVAKGSPAAGGAGRRDATGALLALTEGNGRFVAGRPRNGHRVASALATAGGQQPYAIVLSCLDSRVPPEAVFDCGFGEIGVVRTAGHVLDVAALGSLEFAVEEFAVPLILVLGHTRCGAVGAAMAALQEGRRPGGAVGHLVEAIVPAVQEAGLAGDDAYGRAVDRHVQRTVNRLVSEPVLAAAHRDGRLAVRGARYDLDSGRVTVLDD